MDKVLPAFSRAKSLEALGGKTPATCCPGMWIWAWHCAASWWRRITLAYCLETRWKIRVQQCCWLGSDAGCGVVAMGWSIETSLARAPALADAKGSAELLRQAGAQLVSIFSNVCLIAC